MLLFWRSRPQSDTLVTSGIKDRRWLIQFIIAFTALVLIVSGYFYFTYELPGELGVVSKPKGAEILVNRAPTGFVTPAVIRGLKPGDYIVEIRRESYVSFPSGLAIHVEPGKQSVAKFRLIHQDSLPAQVEPYVPPTPAKPVPPTESRDYRPDLDYPRSDFVPAPIPRERNRFPSVGGSGRVFVSTNIPGASIYLDGQLSPQETDAWLLMPLGMHRIQVMKAGFKVDIPEASVLISTAFQEQRLNFQLTPINVSTQRPVIIQTSPIDGPITIDNSFHSIGKWEGNLSFGAHLIEFGDVTGYIKPPEMRIIVTQTDPSQPVAGYYKTGYAVELRVDGDGKPVSSNLTRWFAGIVHPDVGGFKNDINAGPKISFVRQWNRYAWEFGLAYANKNPVGGQFLQIDFNLPKHNPNDPQMFLWVQAVRGTTNYPLTFMNRTLGVIEVNGRPVASEWAPSRVWNTSDPDGWERVSISERLIEGKNSIRIYSHDLNLRYFYIGSIRVGPQSEDEARQ